MGLTSASLLIRFRFYRLLITPVSSNNIVHHRHSKQNIVSYIQLAEPSHKMMYDSWFARLREEDDDLATLEEQQALLDFLNDKTSANEASRYYTSAVAESDDPNGMYIWSLLYTVARNLPQTQDKLIELLQGIQRLPDLERNGKVETAFGEKFWSELPGFAVDLREIWDGKRYRLYPHSRIESLLTSA